MTVSLYNYTDKPFFLEDGSKIPKESILHNVPKGRLTELSLRLKKDKVPFISSINSSRMYIGVASLDEVKSKEATVEPIGKSDDKFSIDLTPLNETLEAILEATKAGNKKLDSLVEKLDSLEVKDNTETLEAILEATKANAPKTRGRGAKQDDNNR